jgi:hypothetical protein
MSMMADIWLLISGLSWHVKGEQQGIGAEETKNFSRDYAWIYSRYMGCGNPRIRRRTCAKWYIIFASLSNTASSVL